MKNNEENVEIEVLELSPEDSLIFAEAILNPREPSEVLRRDFELYEKMVISDQDDIGETETNSSSPKKRLTEV
jgi:hypothetical protein